MKPVAEERIMAKTNTTLILNTNASNFTFTLDVDLRYGSKKFPALSRIQRALDKFLTNNSHWLAEDRSEEHTSELQSH